ncbi:MFS-type transporter involved in bile tolerance, Atg22 family [Arthrobacter sp. 49Tsu3.1M3]|uniref:MFS transporter n=1 Tax=Arthrobacter sp. 49Tsu3.1M3 TaxID=1279029 RepID=UPI0009A87BD4|nr:MFS transporter [Arthrobacter sp. 49Tsu3.1M3]SKB39696.1 MFS-type transporter involved in bile tolerance, Atg22 family [Arthrobacter sp. 49Tsu3.1M3]
MISPETPPVSTATESPATGLLGAEEALFLTAPSEESDLPKVSAKYIWLMVLAQLGVFIAFITPIAISLAVKVSQVTPGQEQNLGYILGAGSLVVMLTGPMLGTLSDRTRTSLGRRRPFIIAGTALGLVSLIVMATADSIVVLALGWVLAQLGWGQALAGLNSSQADRLPESQRGKVSGLVGFANQIGPVVGVVSAGSLMTNNMLLFVVPGIVGVVTCLLFVLFVREESSKSLVFEDRLSLRLIASKYLYNPRQYPDFSWNWLARFLFYFGLTLNTTFTAFFMASRLGVSLQEIAGVIATIGGIGILATTVGAIGGGFLSDRIRRRRPIVLAAAIIFASGIVAMAFAHDMPIIVVGSVLTSIGIGGFSAVDQALLLDVLPEKKTNAGRFLGITGFATSIPQAAAPLIAPLFLTIGATAAEKNYTLLYLVAAGITLLGGVVVLRIKSVR